MTVNANLGARPLTEGQAALLALIDRRLRAKEPVSHNALAKALGGKSPQAIGQMLDRLERDGWITREAGESGRERPIQLPAKARKAVKA